MLNWWARPVRNPDSRSRASPARLPLSTRFFGRLLNGCQLTLKLETANPIRSFKGRGADFLLSEAGPEGTSAGNWGQAMAYADRARGRKLIVFAATNANPLKIQSMSLFGADVRLQGGDFDAAKLTAKQYAESVDAWMVEDGLEPEVSEGAGSIAVELPGGSRRPVRPRA